MPRANALVMPQAADLRLYCGGLCDFLFKLEIWNWDTGSKTGSLPLFVVKHLTFHEGKLKKKKQNTTYRCFETQIFNHK